MARLNQQGLQRRDPGLMRCILPELDCVTVSIDLAAGEPTVTQHFSQDPRYRFATIDGVGQKPYYADDSVLMVDDIYLMVMSVSPMGRQLMWDTYHNHLFSGKYDFTTQWMLDAEVVKSHLKKQRQFHKILQLGIGYGMQPPAMVVAQYNAGYTLSLPEAKAFFRAYWKLFIGVKRLADRLERQVRADGYLVNPFGYRLVPDRPSKGFNYYIQSSVSGIMHVFLAKLMQIAPYAHFKTVIHDELVVDCPRERLAEFREAVKTATDSLNEDLKWSVAIRTGFAPGNNWYEAK